MPKTTIAIIAATLMGACLTASAADEYVHDGRFYLTPKVSYGFFGNAHNTALQDGRSEGYGVAFGKPINKYWNLEAYYYNFDDIDADDGPGLADKEGYGLTALYFPAPESSRVFLLAGYSMGTHQIDAVGFEADVDNIDFGYGYMHTINDYGVSVRIEYRYRNTDVDSAADDADSHIVSASLQIPLGAPPAQR